MGEVECRAFNKVGTATIRSNLSLLGKWVLVANKGLFKSCVNCMFGASNAFQMGHETSAT